VPFRHCFRYKCPNFDHQQVREFQICKKSHMLQ
jgi:hypothetical protein